MGFKRGKVYNLKFQEDSEFYGFEVQCRPPSIDALAYAAEMKGGGMAIVEFRKLLEYFADTLISWNLEDENDEPVAPTYENVCKQDQSMLEAIVDAWYDGVTGIDDPLGQPSGDGDPSLVASLPMEPLSASQAS